MEQVHDRAKEEFALHGPDCSSEYFFIEKRGKGWKPWRVWLISGTELECYLEDEQRWQAGTVESWFTDDASGNAPETDRHFFLTWKDDKGEWRYDLHHDLKVRLEVPTDEALRAAPKWCEGYDYGWHPSEDSHCNEPGTLYVYPSGYESWYCPVHMPKSEEVQQATA